MHAPNHCVNADPAPGFGVSTTVALPRKSSEQSLPQAIQRRAAHPVGPRDVEPEVNLFLKDLSGMQVEDRE